MNTKLIDDTLYILLSNLYPSVSGEVGDLIGLIICGVLAAVLAYGFIELLWETARKFLTDQKMDLFARTVGILLSGFFCLMFLGGAISFRHDYRMSKLAAMLEKVQQDSETAAKIETIKKELEDLNNKAIRFR
jgi:hypothetical protein